MFLTLHNEMCCIMNFLRFSVATSEKHKINCSTDYLWVSRCQGSGEGVCLSQSIKTKVTRSAVETTGEYSW